MIAIGTTSTWTWAQRINAPVDDETGEEEAPRVITN
jgi:hypothetical protein